ncbi:MAG: DUF1614 domain-containing protein [Ktedonobacterales bacterium]|nr:DUF1614 domain-containing protein [Ktedonobacterales bacterium]
MQARHTHNHPAFPAMLLMFLLPIIFLLIYFNVVNASFRTLGLSSTGASLLLIGSLVGSTINLPLTRRRIVLADPMLANMSPLMRQLATVFHYYPPAVVEEVLAVNVGGALVPLGFSIYLFTLPTTAIPAALIATAIVALAAKLLARPLPGVGITLPGYIPPLLAALVAFLLVRQIGPHVAAAPVAYIAGSLGALIGADVLNLPLVLRGGLLAASPTRLWLGSPARKAAPIQPRILSIGGAGIFDGVFLAGVIAAFLASR